MKISKYLFIDATSENIFFYLNNNKKIFQKKFNKVEKTENLIFCLKKFFKVKKIKLSKDWAVFVNLGPGNYIGIRNSIVLSKIISTVYNTKVFGLSFFDILKSSNILNKANFYLFSFKNKNLLLDLKRKKVTKLINFDYLKWKKKYYFLSNCKKVSALLKVKLFNYTKKEIDQLVINNKFSKKLIPISVS